MGICDCNQGRLPCSCKTAMGPCQLIARPSQQGRTYEALVQANAQVAALREELAELEDEFDTLEHSNITLKLKLSAAEQRNADQLKLLHMSKELLSTISLHKAMAPNDWCDSFKNEVADRLEKLRSALAKPTESGASE